MVRKVLAGSLTGVKLLHVKLPGAMQARPYMEPQPMPVTVSPSQLVIALSPTRYSNQDFFLRSHSST